MGLTVMDDDWALFALPGDELVDPTEVIRLDEAKFIRADHHIDNRC
jgi:hypothetical protein